MTIDPASVRAPSGAAKSRPVQRVRRVDGLFLRGPVPMDWLRAAMRAPGDALAVGVELWHLAGMRVSMTVDVSVGRLSRATGADRKTARRAVQALESAGLVSVVRPPGRQLRVTINQEAGKE